MTSDGAVQLTHEAGEMVHGLVRLGGAIAYASGGLPRIHVQPMLELVGGIDEARDHGSRHPRGDPESYFNHLSCLPPGRI